MKKLVLYFVFTIGMVAAFAQRTKNENLLALQKKEDSLQGYALKIVQGITAEARFNADSIFTKMFVRALLTKNSFNYYFDSLETISKLYAPDSSFKIFTWQMVINENMVRQHGAIQMKTNDGSLKLYPLIDKSDITLLLTDTVTSNKAWMGAIYYKIIETKHGSKNYFTLLGFDENNIRSDKKIIETLYFDNNEPSFGAHLFSFEEDSLKQPAMSRYIMEYKKGAGPRLTYDEDLAMLVFEHLESESNEPNKKWTYIPDGDYEGFKWKNGKWIHVNKVFNLITPEGNEPVPNPVKNAAGNTDEDKLLNYNPAVEKSAPVKKKPARTPQK
ncbi:MAG: hypothetical protein ABIN94_16025 [Ferruginibacter sp.]